jgi:hypothetical protein
MDVWIELRSHPGTEMLSQVLSVTSLPSEHSRSGETPPRNWVTATVSDPIDRSNHISSAQLVAVCVLRSLLLHTGLRACIGKG